MAYLCTPLQVTKVMDGLVISRQYHDSHEFGNRWCNVIYFFNTSSIYGYI